MAGLPSWIRIGSEGKKSFLSNQHDFLVSNKTPGQVMALRHFILEEVEFPLIFVRDKKLLSFSP